MIIENENLKKSENEFLDFSVENRTEPTVDYEKRIKDLEKEVKELKELLEGDVKAKTYTAVGGFSPDSRNMVNVPFVISNEQKNLDKKQRQAGFGLAVIPNVSTESIQASITAQKYVDMTSLPPALNRVDFSQLQEGQLTMDYQPDINRLFVCSFLTPLVDGTGFIKQGENTLTDHTAKFKPNQFITTAYNNGILYIANTQGQYEAHKILSNTSDTITIDGTWAFSDGSYDYYLFFPAYLGSASFPFKRLYVGEDIRLGYGDSAGTQVAYIKFGNGSPEGVVTAPTGSLYLNLDGGANTSFYVKTAGTGNTNWQALADFGTSGLPFTNLYVTTDIRLGSGGSSAYFKIGSGSPEGVVTAPTGSIYLNLNGGANTTLYVKTSGTGNTGWTAK